MKINRKVGIILLISILGIWIVGYREGYREGYNKCRDMILKEIKNLEELEKKIKDSEDIIKKDINKRKFI